MKTETQNDFINPLIALINDIVEYVDPSDPYFEYGDILNSLVQRVDLSASEVEYYEESYPGMISELSAI